MEPMVTCIKQWIEAGMSQNDGTVDDGHRNSFVYVDGDGSQLYRVTVQEAEATVQSHG